MLSEKLNKIKQEMAAKMQEYKEDPKVLNDLKRADSPQQILKVMCNYQSRLALRADTGGGEVAKLQEKVMRQLTLSLLNERKREWKKHMQQDEEHRKIEQEEEGDEEAQLVQQVQGKEHKEYLKQEESDIAMIAGFYNEFDSATRQGLVQMELKEANDSLSQNQQLLAGGGSQVQQIKKEIEMVEKNITRLNLLNDQFKPKPEDKKKEQDDDKRKHEHQAEHKEEPSQASSPFSLRPELKPQSYK